MCENFALSKYWDNHYVLRTVSYMSLASHLILHVHNNNKEEGYFQKHSHRRNESIFP